MDQRYDDALRLLEQAVALDGSNSDLLTFRDSVKSAKERATGLRRALRRAEAALQDGDLDEAQNAVSEAFKIDPHDTQAKALKVVIAQQAEEKLRHEQVRKLLDEARNQIAARNLTAAFTVLKNAESLDPTSNELQTVVKLAMAAREQEKRRAETEGLRQQIEAALREEDYATAVARADEGLRRFPQEQSLLKLKALADAQRLRVEQKKFVREQFSAANSLADAGQFREAVALLERALQRAPGNSELESLRATFLDRLATEEARQRKQQAVETTLAEGERILRERGARNASEFLAARAAENSHSQQFRELYDSVREREALDALDSRLASEPNPVTQVQLAEEALRHNPNNRGIQQRVADLRQRRDQIDAIVERAQAFEAAARSSDALREWQQLCSAYPQVPEFEAQVRRIASLQAESKRARAVPPVTAPPVVPEPSKESGVNLSATQVYSGVRQQDVAPAGTTPAVPKVSVAPPSVKMEPPAIQTTPPQRPTPPDGQRQSENLLAGSNKYIAIAVGVVVLVVVGYLIPPPKKTVTVRFNTDPADASVTVGTQSCHAPCDLSLKVGSYELRAEREGYQSVTESVTIAADTKSLPVIGLTPMPPPPTPSSPVSPVVEQGTLIVRSNVDAAEVFVDGDQKGVTTHNKYEGKFDVGSHQITLRKSEYKDSQPQSVEIAKGRPATVNIPLEKGKSEVAYIVITTNPGATVAIDGKAVEGRVPRVGRRTQPVAPGTHTVQVILDGYEPYNGQADVKLGEKLSIYANLKPTAKPQLPQPPTPPTIVFFTPTPSSVQQGQSVQLSWKTENANDVSIDPIGRVEGSSKVVSPTKTTSYTLIARGPGGTARSESVTVAVSAPPPPPTPLAKAASIDDFEAGQDSIQKGQSTKLIWHTEDATDVSIDPGIGSVPARGSRQVTPSETTIYTIKAKGAGGAAEPRSVKVVVEEIVVVGDPKQCIDRFRDAYESKDVTALTQVWSTLANNSKRLKAITDQFAGVESITLQLLCPPPSMSGDTAHFQCNQTMIYKMKGSSLKPLKNSAELVCKRTAAGWVVEDYIVK